MRPVPRNHFAAPQTAAKRTPGSVTLGILPQKTWRPELPLFLAAALLGPLMTECWFPRIVEVTLASWEGPYRGTLAWQAELALYDVESETEIERQPVGAPLLSYIDAALRVLAALNAANAALAFGPGASDG